MIEKFRFIKTVMTSIQAQLTQDLADVSWKDLIPHCQRNAVIVVHEGLDVVEVGVAIALASIRSRLLGSPRCTMIVRGRMLLS